MVLGGFAHIVAGEVEVFYLGVTGAASWGEVCGGFLAPTLTGNILGGVSLVAAVNHAQVVARDEEDPGYRQPRKTVLTRTFKKTCADSPEVPIISNKAWVRMTIRPCSRYQPQALTSSLLKTQIPERPLFMFSAKTSAVVPSSEQEVLALTIEDAIDLGLSGSIRDGHRALQVGLELAREAEVNGEAWGAALVTLWQAAVDEYCAQFGAMLTGIAVDGPASRAQRCQAA